MVGKKTVKVPSEHYGFYVAITEDLKTLRDRQRIFDVTLLVFMLASLAIDVMLVYLIAGK